MWIGAPNSVPIRSSPDSLDKVIRESPDKVTPGSPDMVTLRYVGQDVYAKVRDPSGMGFAERLQHGCLAMFGDPGPGEISHKLVPSQLDM